MLIVLTNAGRNLRKKAAGVPGCVGAASGLTHDELLQLTHGMAKLNASLTAYADSVDSS